MKLKMRAMFALSASLLGLAGYDQQATPTTMATPTGVEQKVTGSRNDPGY
jgi:hypothetical protein